MLAPWPKRSSLRGEREVVGPGDRRGVGGVQILRKRGVSDEGARGWTWSGLGRVTAGGKPAVCWVRFDANRELLGAHEASFRQWNV